jgi:hypothetical protein
MNLTIDINVNFPGVLPFLTLFKGKAMTLLEDLQASTAALTAKVEEANAKTDALILIANTTKDALVALQGQPAGLPITSADIQAVIDAQTAAVASLNAQEAETDAASVAVAP